MLLHTTHTKNNITDCCNEKWHQRGSVFMSHIGTALEFRRCSWWVYMYMSRSRQPTQAEASDCCPNLTSFLIKIIITLLESRVMWRNERFLSAVRESRQTATQLRCKRSVIALYELQSKFGVWISCRKLYIRLEVVDSKGAFQSWYMVHFHTIETNFGQTNFFTNAFLML